jgi:Alkaline phosphatase
MFKSKKIILSVAAALVLVISSIVMGMQVSAVQGTATNNTYNGKAPKYVFLFIGDGMSYSQIYSAEAYQGSHNHPGTVGIDKLSFSQFPVAGAASTYDASSICPDSASTATSMATGNKTLSGVINMDPNKTVKYKTIAEMAKASGYKVGVISSVSIDHATPAAFYAHQPTRSNYYDIGVELVNSNFDFFGGGGFLQPTGAKGDQPDVLGLAKVNGYKIVNTKQDILALNNTSGKVIATNAVLDAEKALPYEIDRSSDDLSLADFTREGIEVLDNPKGFFMMVEGGKIDWTCHANDAATEIKDTMALDEAVDQAIAFYNKHPQETLIIVTADHETGGMTIGFAGTGYSTYFDKLGYQQESYDAFNQKVKDYVNTISPEAARLEDLYPAIQSSFGLAPTGSYTTGNGMVLTEYETQRLLQAFEQTVIPAKERTYTDEDKLLYGTYEPLTVTLTHILDNKAGIGWTSYAHTGVPVPVFAMGSGQDLFNGYFDNTDIFNKLHSIMKLK